MDHLHWLLVGLVFGTCRMSYTVHHKWLSQASINKFQGLGYRRHPQRPSSWLTLKCVPAGLSGDHLLTEYFSKQVEKAYQKQHLFQNAKARGASKNTEASRQKLMTWVLI